MLRYVPSDFPPGAVFLFGYDLRANNKKPANSKFTGFSLSSEKGI